MDDLNETIAAAIAALDQAGWHRDADLLQRDAARAGTCLPDLLMVRDDAERLLAELEANQPGTRCQP